MKCLTCGKDITAISVILRKQWCCRECEDNYHNSTHSCDVVDELMKGFNINHN